MKLNPSLRTTFFFELHSYIRTLTNMNRRQRRAKGPQTATLQSADDIPMSRPREDEAKPRGKTLYEIAADRQAQMGIAGKPFSAVDATKENVKYVKITPDGKTVDVTENGEVVKPHDDDDEAGPVLDTLFLASSLSALHFTLDVLTVHQYAEQLRLPPIFLNTLLVVFPTLFFLVHLLHGHLPLLSSAALSERTRNIFSLFQQGLFIITANVAGCYLIHLTNDKGYYAVMKKAPSVGTIWVWSVLELGLIGSLAGVTGPGIFAWYYGHSIW
jgi:hypothetical protein